MSGYEAGTADGMNEQGLVMNGLYLAESDYGKPDDRPTMSIMAYGQYVLDGFSKVAEVVDGMRSDSFRVVAPVLPNGKGAQLHMSLSDPTGDSAMFEYINGKLVIHHGKQYKVMTNSPSYDQQLAIEAYWQGVDPLQSRGLDGAGQRRTIPKQSLIEAQLPWNCHSRKTDSAFLVSAFGAHRASAAAPSGVRS